MVNILILSINGIRFPLQVNCVFVFPGRRNGAENLQQGKRMDEIRLGGKLSDWVIALPALT